MKKEYFHLLVAGIALITISIILMILLPAMAVDVPIPDGATNFAMALGIAFVFVAFFNHWWHGEESIEKDEMTERITNKAMAVSWLISLALVCAFAIVKAFVDIGADLILFILIFVMGWSAALFMIYYKKNPERI